MPRLKYSALISINLVFRYACISLVDVWPVRQSDRSGRVSRPLQGSSHSQSNFPLRYNVAPTDQIPIVRIDPRDGKREVVMARWGLIPFWMKEKPKVPHINARAETVHKLPLFREAFAKRRCLIPATGFYEWQKRDNGKQPYRFRRKDLEPFAFAGIWEFARLGGEGWNSTAMIVGEANPLVGGVHDRMPVMLMSADYDRSAQRRASTTLKLCSNRMIRP